MTARTSSSLMWTASFGSGLPPAAAMSPPALWTRMSMAPSSATTVSMLRSTSAAFVRSARIFTVRTPCPPAIARATSVSVSVPPYSDGPCSRMPCTPTWQPERRQSLRKGTAKPTAGTGDERHLAFECSVGHDGFLLARAACGAAGWLAAISRAPATIRPRGSAPGTWAPPSCAALLPACRGSRTPRRPPRRSGSAGCP